MMNNINEHDGDAANDGDVTDGGDDDDDDERR